MTERSTHVIEGLAGAMSRHALVVLRFNGDMQPPIVGRVVALTAIAARVEVRGGPIDVPLAAIRAFDTSAGSDSPRRRKTRKERT